MKIKKVLWTGVLCFCLLMALGLGGCNKENHGEKCEAACTRIFACLGTWGIDPVYFGGDVETCTLVCTEDESDESKCGVDCDTNLNCTDYGVCLYYCGPPPNDRVCRELCGKTFSCLGEWGVDPEDFGGSIEVCTVGCMADQSPQAQCARGCDTDQTCTDYGSCFAVCEAVEVSPKCQAGCHKIFSCLDEWGMDPGYFGGTSEACAVECTRVEMDRTCELNCNAGASCNNYSQCLVDCEVEMDDKCAGGCDKIFSCLEEWGADPGYYGGTTEACARICREDDSIETQCAMNCSTGVSCNNYSQCLLACGTGFPTDQF